MRKLRVPAAIACLLALAAIAGCSGATDQSADVSATSSTAFSAGSADPNSTNSDPARTAWLTKGGCRPVPTAPNRAFTGTIHRPTADPADRQPPPRC